MSTRTAFLLRGPAAAEFRHPTSAHWMKRIKVVVPSCFISSLPMRAYNRIFADPDSDPEQDPYGMISEGVDHAGLLLLIYPRPLMIASAVLDFFPIEGARNTFREISDLYDRFHQRPRRDG